MMANICYIVLSPNYNFINVFNIAKLGGAEIYENMDFKKQNLKTEISRQKLFITAQEIACLKLEITRFGSARYIFLDCRYGPMPNLIHFIHHLGIGCIRARNRLQRLG